MTFVTMYLAISVVLLSVSLWCIFNPSYDDGIIGKVMYMMMALACYSTIMDYPNESNPVSRLVTFLMLTGVVLRHVFLNKLRGAQVKYGRRATDYVRHNKCD